MNTTLYESQSSLFAKSGDGLWSRDARNLTSRRTMSEEASSGSPAMILNTCDGLASIPSFYLSLIPYFILSFSLSLSPAFSRSFALTACKPAFNEPSDYRSASDRTGTASRRIAPYRITKPLSLATANCLQPPATRLTAYSQLPHHRLHPRHATPFHRLWHHKITT
jgi:hypothetical protein